MNETDILKFLGPYGAVAVVVYLLGRVVLRLVARFFERLIAALDRVGAKVDAHTEVDKSAHAEVRAAIERLDGRVTEIIDGAERREQTGRQELIARTSNPARRPPTGMTPALGSSKLPVVADDPPTPTPSRRKTRPQTSRDDE